MTAQQYLRSNTALLKANSIATARLDCLVIMEHILGTDRAKILSEPSLIISVKQQKLLDKAVKDRVNHVPISYITHNKEFYGRNFFIDSSVLEPRPETESMIDLFKKIMSSGQSVDGQPITKKSLKVADVGTGSGAIGITAKLECPNIALSLIDIDPQALSIAKQNVVLYTMNASVHSGDLLYKDDVAYEILLCNLPYVPDDFSINLAAGHEPKIAIFGGKDGLDIYRKLFKLVKYRQHKPLYIFTEALPTSHSKLQAIANSSGYELHTSDDFIQLFKYVASSTS